MIDYNDAEIALQFLCNTDVDFARAKTLYDGLYEQRKSVIAIEFGKAKGSAAEKTKLAESSEEYQKHLMAVRDAQIEFETLKAKRHTKQLIIDMWRSVNSNRNKGNV